METSAYNWRVLWSLGCFLLFGLWAAALPQDQGKSKADDPKKPALYDPKADARVQIEAASAKAKRDHTRVLVMFGFEGCSWCHKLHALFEQNTEIRKLLGDKYVTVLVDIESPHAIELLKECKGALAREELQKGVGFPFLAVLDEGGKVVTAQRTEPLEEGKGHDPARVKEFLGRWVAARTDPPNPGEIDRMIRLLGEEKFEEREAASKRLEAIGAAAVDALRHAAKTNADAEVRERAAGLVKTILKGANRAAATRTFTGHGDHVTYAVFSPDGRHILSACDDQTARLWEVATGKVVRVFKGHESMVICCLFTLDGKVALTCSGWPPESTDRSIRVWDVQTGKEKRQLVGHTDCVWRIALSPDEKQVLSGSRDNTLRLWDLATGKELRRFDGHTDWVRGVAFAPNGKHIASASWDRTIRLWDVTTGLEVRQFNGHAEGADGVAFTPDGRHLVSAGGRDRTVRLWDVASGKEVRRFEGHEERVWDVSVASDGKRLLSASSDKTVRLWDIATGNELKIYEGHTDEVRSARFSADGRWAISASHDQTLRLWALP